MRNSMFQVVLAIFSLILFNNFYVDNREPNRKFVPVFSEDPAFISADSSWADSVLHTLSLEEKIGQMIMMPAYSNRSSSHRDELLKIIRKDKIGGIIFFQGGPVRQAQMTNCFQHESSVPLLIAMDGEWGLGMRLDSVISYPRQMILGAVQDNDLIYRMGYDIAEQMKQLGIHMNLAPVADINNNPENPVIHSRSFGDSRYNVAEKVIAYFSGMQNNGLLVTAKHFPGHGDTDSDSHLTLPVINHSKQRLDSLELFPFRESFNRGLSGVMVGHLHVPALDDRPGRPSTLSWNIITGLLVEQMGFKGLIVTDALNMRGVSDFMEPGDLEVEAVIAGNDILLMPNDAHKAIHAIKTAVRKGIIPEERIDHSCRKILMAKYWAGLNNIKPVDTGNLTERLNSREYLLLQRKLAEGAITNLVDNRRLLPLKELETKKIATVNIGEKVPNAFTETIDLYLESSHFVLDGTADPASRSQMIKRLEDFNTIMINLYGTNVFSSKKYGISDQVAQFVNDLHIDGDIILNVAGYPYCLNRFSDLSHLDVIMVTYNDEDLYQSVAAQAIFGGIGCTGRTPVSVEGLFKTAGGIDSEGGIRLSYSIPEDAGMNYGTLLKIDSMVADAIKQKATPGCQVLVARQGKVIWHRAYGYHTYLNREPVQLNHLYDLASITKITSTIPALMLLKGQGKFHEDSVLKTYLPGVDTSPKGNLIIKDILTHQAGLMSWIPFYYKLLEPLDASERLINSKWTYTYAYHLGNHAFVNRNVKYIDNVFRNSYSQEYPIQVAKDLYLRADYRDTVYHAIIDSKLGKNEYRYSDLGYYLLHRAIEHITDTLLYPYVYYNFYAPMGATTMGYLPLNRFPEERIVPTENDMFFRRQLIRGTVHDPGAAMLGGISGHAGVFSNANDLAKMMQLYLNGGWYGDRCFLDSSIVRIYTSCAYCENGNRRALGFDRPITNEKNAGPACDDASESSYGHSGFTGTIAWVDPQYDLIYIFLSNKIHPDQSNTKLINNNIRTNIQQVLYDAMDTE